MTVRELIDALAKLSPDLHVFAEGDGRYYEIGAVEPVPDSRDGDDDSVRVWEGLSGRPFVLLWEGVAASVTADDGGRDG